MHSCVYTCAVTRAHTHTHTHTHIHSLATLLGTPCKYWIGPPFASRTALIIRGIDSTRCWKHSSEILVHIDMMVSCSCCRFVGCSSMMRISRSTTSQRCTIELRSGYCGGHLSKVNSLSCSRNQSEMIWALKHGVVFCCCSPSASGFNVLCVQRWYSAYLGCNEWLFELLLPFCHL